MKQEKKQKRYLTKKRRARMMINKTMLIVVAVMLSVGVIGYYSERLFEEIDFSGLVVVSDVEAGGDDGKFVVLSESVREVTMYNAGDPAQCDDSPCISANEENICEALRCGFRRCASNAFPFGTDLLIVSPVTGWQYQCKVTDRMNARFSDRVDIALLVGEYDRAVRFGVQNLIVKEVVLNK